MKFISNLFLMTLILFPGSVFGKNILLPTPTIIVPADPDTNPAGRRKIIYDYIDRYTKEYISEFLRINRTPENKFKLEEVQKKMKEPYMAKSDSQILLVGNSDVLALKAALDEYSVNLYTRSDLQKYNAMTVDNSIAEVFARMDKSVASLATRLDKQTQTLADLNSQIKNQKEELTRLESKIAFASSQSSLSKSGAALATIVGGNEPKSQFPFYLSLLAIGLSGFAIFKKSN